VWRRTEIEVFICCFLFFANEKVWRRPEIEVFILYLVHPSFLGTTDHVNTHGTEGSKWKFRAVSFGCSGWRRKGLWFRIDSKGSRLCVCGCRGVGVWGCGGGGLCVCVCLWMCVYVCVWLCVCMCVCVLFVSISISLSLLLLFCQGLQVSIDTIRSLFLLERVLWTCVQSARTHYIFF
jgi:hypothetical protein